jgi:general secretion pathway protein G
MNRKCGFTLIEMMIVAIIIAALAGMVLPHIIDRGDDVKMNIAAGDIRNISTALDMYRLDNGVYPTTEEGLDALMTAPASARKWKGPYVDKEPLDPWDNPYHYSYKGQHNTLKYDLWSDGPDTASQDDDITNWQD